MKRVFVLILSLLIVIGLSACNNRKNIERDLTATLEEIRTGTLDEDSLVYSSDLSGGNGGSDIYANEAAAKIAGKVQYSISDVSEDETVTADITMTVPDVYAMLEDISLAIEGDSVDALLEELEVRLDSDDFPTEELEVSVELKPVGGRWYLVPNGQLSNAFSGGLVERYSMLGQDVVSSLLEGGN